ncbi:Hsp70 family protein [Paracoccus benzoatiresistens]|uniref:Hsp70 family protein n=1 Tax=Paracoccus benzoatiresistens TaxID=2997341 RepID=A0ABT4J378_9RHOB|nr:Hsp70 family protein [Paracoccus sp. EF6]MCZ0961359.1 Hsp70 family protein [Paracoccus sp. EF6]
MSSILAIDFGTSNSAAAILEGGAVRRVPIEGASDTLPTAVFFPARGGAMRIGDAAAAALIGAEEGRYMRALKSVLGTPLLHESRLIGGRRRTLAQVITAFLTELRQRAEAGTGRPLARVLSGRPVRFHPDPARDAQAEADLRACYHAAGFEDVAFMPEPEAAALACHGMGGASETGLIMDIGGGTSDFSVYRTEGGRVRILASHGIRLGGTDFDGAVSLTHAMPLLGHGSQLRREMGPGLLPVPNAIYVDLADWAHIPFTYTPENRRQARQMARLAAEPALLERLVTLLTDELGHDLAFAVERAKIAANDGTGTQIGMGFIEPHLAAAISRASLGDALEGFGRDLQEAVSDTLAGAGVAAGEIGSVVLVGGSSLMGLVTDLAARMLPAARLHRSEAFTAVVDGLALGTAVEQRS